MEHMPYECPIEIRFRDVDAMNHVNNAVYVTYLEVARSRFWREHLGFAGSANEIPIIVARVAVDFVSPIGLMDEVRVGFGVSHIGTTSFTFSYLVTASGRLAARAETVQVSFDYATSRPVPLQDDLRARLDAFRVQAPLERA